MTLTSALVAWILAKVARLSKQQRNFALACAISPNSNSLPVALMQSLVLTVPQLHWEEDGEPEDTVDAMLGRALTYLVLYSTLGMFVRWSIGAKLLSTVEDRHGRPTMLEGNRYRGEPQQIRDSQNMMQTARLVDVDGSDELSRIVTRDIGQASDRLPQEPLTDGGRPPVWQSTRSRSGPPAWTRSFPNTPDGSSPEESVTHDDDAGDRDMESCDIRSGHYSIWSQLKKRAKRGFHYVIVVPSQAVLGFMTAPLWAAVLSLFVAIIRPLQHFIDSLEPVVGALQTSGACSVPLTMIVLGAYFVQEKAPVDHLDTNIGVSAGSAIEQRGQTSVVGSQSFEDSTAASTLRVPPATNNRGTAPWMRNPWKSGGDSSTNCSGIGGGSSYVGGEGELDAANDEAPQNSARNAQNSPSLPISSLNRQHGSKSLTEKEVEHQRKMEWRTIAVAISSRMLVTPLLLIPPMWWYAVMTRYNVMDDPVFIAAACLIIGSPPALTLAQITSQNAGGNKSLERLISQTIFVSYSIFAAPTTIALVLSALLIAENDH